MRKSLPIILCIAFTLSAGCVTVHKRPPANQHLMVQGQAKSPPLALFEERMGLSESPVIVGVDGAWARREMTAAATTPPPSYSPAPETRRMISRRQAIFRAYRELATQIEQMPGPDNRPLSVHIDTESKARQVEELIQQARVIEEAEQPSGSYYIRLALRTDPLAQIIGAGGRADPSATGQPYNAQHEELRRQAAVAAGRDARQKLFAQVLSASSPEPGKSIADLMAEDEQYHAQVIALVRQAAVTDTRYQPDGLCQVTVELNLDDVYAIER